MDTDFEVREQFQFHKGPIKALCLNYLIVLTPCFNSIKVRLKQAQAENMRKQNTVSIP